jgi:hypothetical protein
MTYNIMAEYTDHTRKFLREFMQEFFKEQYDKDITDEYIETYIEARYNNYGGNEKQRVFYRRIYSALKKSEEKLIYNQYEEYHTMIKNMLELYQYVFYIDFVRPINKDLKEFVNEIYEKRITKFEMKRDGELRNNLYKMIREYREAKEKYLKTFESEDFELVTTKYPLIKDVYKVELKYKFKMPYIFSESAINDVYNENIVNEDKLIVQYLMLTAFNIKMILDGKFNTQYLVDFPMSLFGKRKKLDQALRIINDPSILDKIKIKIKYRDFIIHREEIYELMKNGYKFAVIIDDSFIISKEHIKKLSMFSYVIVSKKLKYFDEFKENAEELENLIIDEG